MTRRPLDPTAVRAALADALKRSGAPMDELSVEQFLDNVVPRLIENLTPETHTRISYEVESSEIRTLESSEIRTLEGLVGINVSLVEHRTQYRIWPGPDTEELSTESRSVDGCFLPIPKDRP